MSSRLPRLQNIKKVLVPPFELRLWGIFLLYCVILTGITMYPAIIIALPGLYSVVILLSLVVWVIGVIHQLRSTWSSNVEIENYIALTLIALSVFTLLGGANYLLYRWNSHSFVIDSELQRRYGIGRARELEQALAASRGNVAFLRALANQVMNRRQSHFIREGNRLECGIPGVELRLFEIPPTLGGSPPVWGVTVTLGEQEVRFDTLKHESFSSAILEVHRRDPPISKSTLVGFFETAAAWESANVVGPLANELVRERQETKIPLTLFLYQAAMDVLGSGPRYFAPANWIARALALFLAFAKYFVFGLFLSTIAKSLSPSGKSSK